MECLERYISTHIHFLSWRTIAILQETYVIGVRELEGSNEGHDAMPLKHAVTWLAVLAGRPRSQVFFFAIIQWRLDIIPGKSNTNKRSTAAYIMMPMFFGVRELPFHSNAAVVAVPVNSESPDLDRFGGPASDFSEGMVWSVMCELRFSSWSLGVICKRLSFWSRSQRLRILMSCSVKTRWVVLTRAARRNLSESPQNSTHSFHLLLQDTKVYF